MAMMATMAIATSSIVMPRSWRREGPVQRNLRIAGGFILAGGFQRTIYRGERIVQPSVRVRGFNALIFSYRRCKATPGTSTGLAGLCSIFPSCDPGCKPLAALGTLNLLKVDAADSVRRYRISALRAASVERQLNFFEIDLLAGWHCAIFSRTVGGAFLQIRMQKQKPRMR